MFALLLFLSGCTAPGIFPPSALPTPLPQAIQAPPPEQPLPEQPVIEIPLAGPLAQPEAEISSLAWDGEWLILTPQFPSRFGPGDGALFRLAKADILAFLDGQLPGPLTPETMPFIAPGLARAIRGYEGIEALTLSGDRVYAAAEAQQGRDAMRGWLVAGHAEGTGKRRTIRLDPGEMRWVAGQAPLDNMGYEALAAFPGAEGPELLLIYEANGVNVTSQPLAYRFDAQLNPLGPIPFPSLEFRITDATQPDAAGRFWAINYFWPGDRWKLRPGPDELAERYGQGPTHARNLAVERLVELQLGPDGVTLTGRPPILLELLPGTSRNWEGLVRLDDRGFLLATDTFPRTILAFAPLPE